MTTTAAHLASVLPAALATRTRVELMPEGQAAGVLVLLFDHDGEAHVVLTKRSDTLAHHRGEVSFPGGRHEPDDADLLVTALRETDEEIGVPVSALTVLGPLDDVHTLASGFTVTPWVAHHPDGRPVMTPDPDEIARIIEVPLADILAADSLIGADTELSALRYPLHGETVWGLTARILRVLATVVHELAPADRPA
ncbi:MAG: CoA pyrophosphatase [Thermoleophilia bacterium]|nr:CoA pyrophosphatase [Thermoleophilia bacterium]